MVEGGFLKHPFCTSKCLIDMGTNRPMKQLSKSSHSGIPACCGDCTQDPLIGCPVHYHKIKHFYAPFKLSVTLPDYKLFIVSSLRSFAEKSPFTIFPHPKPFSIFLPSALTTKNVRRLSVRDCACTKRGSLTRNASTCATTTGR